MKPCREYLEEVSAQEIIFEDSLQHTDVKQISKRRNTDNQNNDSLLKDPLKLVEIPKKVPFAPTFESLEERRRSILPDRTENITLRKSYRLEEETDELLKPLNYKLNSIQRSYNML